MFHVRCSNEIDTPFVANLVEKSGINTVTGTHKKNKLGRAISTDISPQAKPGRSCCIVIVLVRIFHRLYTTILEGVTQNRLRNGAK